MNNTVVVGALALVAFSVCLLCGAFHITGTVSAGTVLLVCVAMIFSLKWL